MSDEIRSNLEPIEDSDLALEKKFGGDNSNKETLAKPENINLPEKKESSIEKAQENEKKYQKIVAKVKSDDKTGNDDSIDDEAEVISKEKDVANKVQSLVAIAENKGVVHAVKVAKHLEDNYVLDELHDKLLSDELHQALMEKGLIQDV